eukprot:8295459-Alexandrium_andersonii.AAC.1
MGSMRPPRRLAIEAALGLRAPVRKEVPAVPPVGGDEETAAREGEAADGGGQRREVVIPPPSPRSWRADAAIWCPLPRNR